MKFLLPILTIAILTSISCKKNKNPIKACGVENPLANIPWLKKTLDEQPVAGSVTLMTYNNQHYFAFQPVTMSCRYCYIYACDGTQLKSPDHEDLLQILQTSKDVTRQVIHTYGEE